MSEAGPTLTATEVGRGPPHLRCFGRFGPDGGKIRGKMARQLDAPTPQRQPATKKAPAGPRAPSTGPCRVATSLDRPYNILNILARATAAGPPQCHRGSVVVTVEGRGRSAHCHRLDVSTNCAVQCRRWTAVTARSAVPLIGSTICRSRRRPVEEARTRRATLESGVLTPCACGQIHARRH